DGEAAGGVDDGLRGGRTAGQPREVQVLAARSVFRHGACQREGVLRRPRQRDAFLDRLEVPESVELVEQGVDLARPGAAASRCTAAAGRTTNCRVRFAPTARGGARRAVPAARTAAA